ncbi:unnamed protein product [Pleuronectes platessa]|uniref:Uncharacterized protein n=1 Tax=Pleuronectes platessa TaxID=8262 RepID=A0A9N7U0S2_PLEPL|nr:unnamed protein product [Pleuronectes platessa]
MFDVLEPDTRPLLSSYHVFISRSSSPASSTGFHISFPIPFSNPDSCLCPRLASVIGAVLVKLMAPPSGSLSVGNIRIYHRWQCNKTDAMETVAGLYSTVGAEVLGIRRFPQKLPVSLKAAGADHMAAALHHRPC